ncbi:MAG TPA: response regulator transcription factor [Burkholderiales bacterium]
MKILIADDHALFRDGLRYMLAGLADEVTILEAKDSTEALATVGATPDLDLVLLDLAMPGMDGLAGLRALRGRRPALPVVILSASEEPIDVRRAIESGAMGFIPKASSSAVMLGALRLVLSGGVYVPPAYLARSRAGTTPITAPSADTLGLTPRQHDVLRLLGQGQSNKEIARVLGLAEGTVKLHISAILRALGVSNRTRAVVAAARLLGLAADPPAQNK